MAGVGDGASDDGVDARMNRNSLVPAYTILHVASEGSCTVPLDRDMSVDYS